MVDYIVNNAGARPKDRDEIDKRIIQDFLDRKGEILDSQDEVEGYPEHKATYRKLDIPEKDIGKWLNRFSSELE